MKRSVKWYRPRFGPEWDRFEQKGHEFVRDYFENDLWCCIRCGSTKDAWTGRGFPDDSWAELRMGDLRFSELQDFDTCEEACVLAIMNS